MWSLLPSLGSKYDDLIWRVDRPWGMGRRDSRWLPWPLRGAGMPPLWPLLAHPAGQAFWAGLSGPGQSQGGRWVGSLGFGPREGLW